PERPRSRLRSAGAVRAAAAGRHARGHPGRPPRDARRLVGRARARHRGVVADVEEVKQSAVGSRSAGLQACEGKDTMRITTWLAGVVGVLMLGNARTVLAG